MALRSIGGIQSESLRKYAGLRRNVDAVRVMEIAKTVLTHLWGEEKAALVRGISFHDGELKLATAASIVVGELKLIDVRFRNEINRAIGRKIVETIKIVQA